VVAKFAFLSPFFSETKGFEKGCAATGEGLAGGLLDCSEAQPPTKIANIPTQAIKDFFCIFSPPKLHTKMFLALQAEEN